MKIFVFVHITIFFFASIGHASQKKYDCWDLRRKLLDYNFSKGTDDEPGDSSGSKMEKLKDDYLAHYRLTTENEIIKARVKKSDLTADQSFQAQSTNLDGGAQDLKARICTDILAYDHAIRRIIKASDEICSKSKLNEIKRSKGIEAYKTAINDRKSFMKSAKEVITNFRTHVYRKGNYIDRFRKLCGNSSQYQSQKTK